MTPIRSHNSLKKPIKQERAKTTIATILEATTHLLEKEGYEKVNTNKIAEVAGVSIGSIYQYFKNKESIIGALIEIHIQKLMNVFLENYKKLNTVSLQEGIRILIKSMIAARRIAPKLQKVFDEQLPKIGKLSRLREYEKQAVEMIKNYLQLRKNELSVKNLELASFVSVHAVEAVVQVAVNHQQDMLKGENLENELSDLIYRYLVNRSA